VIKERFYHSPSRASGKRKILQEMGREGGLIYYKGFLRICRGEGLKTHGGSIFAVRSYARARRHCLWHHGTLVVTSYLSGARLGIIHMVQRVCPITR